VLAGQQFGEQKLDMHAGDTLAMFTDGMTDARDPDNERYGRARLAASINEAARSSDDVSAQDVVKDAIGRVRRFANGAKLPDDQTIVVLRVRS